MERKFNLCMILKEEENKLLSIYRANNPEIKITTLLKKFLFQYINKNIEPTPYG